ncbi:hypothetical protein V7S43_016306 [Phytophthora oleae]|uniref:PH domain-containing protein n=1 Tax=Phytophthora oleae TaxID=2107226 RepID=A0ABD3EXM0_9STRA
MPLPAFRTSRFASTGASSVNSAIRDVASGSVYSSRCSSRPLRSKTSTVSQENRRVVRQAMVCAGSLRVRSCKLLWKPAALQLMVTTTTSLSEDEAHFDDCDDDSDDSEDDDIDKLTTMARPNKTHHYSLVFCHRSLIGHARRERIELDNIRDPVELIWGEDGLLSTRFEFSIVYGSVGPSGRRRTLTCRARDAKDYLQWTDALRMAMRFQGKNKSGKDMTMNRSTHAHTLASSKAPSNSPGSIGSFFDAVVIEEQRQLLDREERKGSANTPTSPTAATAAKAIAPPEANIAEESALKPVPADIASEYGVGRRRLSLVVKPMPRSAGTRLQRRMQSVPPVTMAKPLSMVPLRCSISKAAKVTTLPPFNTPHSTRTIEPKPPVEVTIARPCGRRRRRSGATRSRARVRNISLPDGARAWKPHTPDSNSGSKRSRLRVSPTSQPEEKRPRGPSSPLASIPVLGALPMLQSPSSLTESPLDFIDSSRTTEIVESLVEIAGVSSVRQRQKLLQGQPRPFMTKRHGLPMIPRKSEKEDPWLMSCRSSRLNLDMCDFEDVKSVRSNRPRTHGKSWSAYLKAMECEL